MRSWPAPGSWATASRSLASLRATSVTRASPGAARSFATARPIPSLPPVIRMSGTTVLLGQVPCEHCWPKLLPTSKHYLDPPGQEASSSGAETGLLVKRSMRASAANDQGGHAVRMSVSTLLVEVAHDRGVGATFDINRSRGLRKARPRVAP